MKSIRALLVLKTLFAVALYAHPGVKTVKTTTMKFHGFLGTMMKMSGGDKAYTSTTYLDGSRMRSDRLTEDGKLENSTITDLDREVIVNLDHKKKEYTEMTFAEFKEMMAKMKEKMAGMQPQASQGSADIKMEYDFKVDRTGEKQTIAGFHAEKVIMTMTAKGETQATPATAGGKGGMVITSTQWLTTDAPGKAEAIAFGQKFAQKMGLALGADGSANQWQTLAAFNPQLAKAIEKLAEEGKKMEGVAVKTESVFESWADPAAQTAPAGTGKTQEMPSSVSGLFGSLGKSMGGKSKAGSAPGRSVMFESTEETKEINTGSFSGDLFSTPAGYKKVERKK
ncbi:MAG: hypothetical protein ACREOO_29220 [bacterium]